MITSQCYHRLGGDQYSNWQSLEGEVVQQKDELGFRCLIIHCRNLLSKHHKFFVLKGAWFSSSSYWFGMVIFSREECKRLSWLSKPMLEKTNYKNTIEYFCSWCLHSGVPWPFLVIQISVCTNQCYFMKLGRPLCKLSSLGLVCLYRRILWE